MTRSTFVVFALILWTAALGPAQESEDLSEDAATVEEMLIHGSYLRFSAVRRWLLERPEASVPILVEFLDYSRWEFVREIAAECIGKIGEPARAAIPALVRCLARPNDPTACLAAKALAEFGEAAVPSLLEAVQGDDPRLVLQAGDLLMELKFDRERFAEILLERVRDGDGEIRVAAAWLLGRMTDASHRFLGPRGDPMRGSPKSRLAVPPRATGPRRMGAALAATLADDPDPEVRLTAARALGAAGQDGAEGRLALRRQLVDEDDRVRVAAARALGGIDPIDPGILNALCVVINRQTGPVRQEAIRALAQMGASGRRRLECLAKSNDTVIRQMAVAALEEMNANRDR